MKPQLEIKKIFVVVLYRFAHGFNFKHMWNRFDVGASIIQKYMDLIYAILYDKDKFFDKTHKYTFF